MPENEPNYTLRFRILRYAPNLVRDEWVNVGVLLEETQGPRRAFRVIQESGEIARVRRLHPAADENLLRALPGEFNERLEAREEEVRIYLDKLEQNLSNVLQLGPQRGLLAEDFDTELARIYREYVAPPPSPRLGTSTARGMLAWLRSRLEDTFLRRGLRGKLQRHVRVDEFTQPGDSMKIDYGYRFNGTRGYIQAIALAGEPQRATVLAFTAARIRARQPNAVFTAITDGEPSPQVKRHQFIAGLFEDQHIDIVSINRIDRFAEDLRQHLQ